MNRLTEPGGGIVNGKACQERGVELYWRLKEYEDTELSPEEIIKVRDAYNAIAGKGVSFARITELILAEREGRTVVLPCKLHEPVYIREGADIFEDIPYEVGMGQRQGEREDSLLYLCEDGFSFYGEEVGKTVFLREEDAECSR